MNPQFYIDSLRARRFADTLGYLDALYSKYFPIFKRQLSTDEVLPLMACEFINTDISIKDIDSLRYLAYCIDQAFNIDNKPSELKGRIESIFTSFYIGLTEILIYKQDPALVERLKAIQVTDGKDSFDRLTALLNSVQYSNEYSKLMNKPLSEEVIEQNAFYEPIIARSIQELKDCDQMKQYIDQYLTLLNTEIEKFVTDAEQSGWELSKEIPPGQIPNRTKFAELRKDPQFKEAAGKLYNRFSAVATLQKETAFCLKVSPVVKVKIMQTLDICRANEPSLKERFFLDKLAEIARYLGLGQFFKPKPEKVLMTNLITFSHNQPAGVRK